jgi:hypothetical protein
MDNSSGSSNQGIFAVITLAVLGLVGGAFFYTRTPNIASVAETKSSETTRPVAAPHLAPVIERVKVTEQSAVVTSLADLPKKVERLAETNPELEKRYAEYHSQFHCSGTSASVCAYVALDLALKRTELDVQAVELKHEFWKGVSHSYADSRSMLLDLADQTTESDQDVRIAIQKKLSALEYVSQNRKSDPGELNPSVLEETDDQFRVGVDPTTQKSTYILYSGTETVDGEPKVLYSRTGDF